MKQKTLLLFQLLLAVFSIYSVLKYSGNQRMTIPLTCLVAMFLVGKVETAVTEKDKRKKELRARARKGTEEKTGFKPVDCLLKSKNALLLTDAIHYLLSELGLKVSRSPDHSFIDRLVRTDDDSQVTFGLKVLGDVGELTETWESWGEVTDFDMGKGGNRRLVLISSNTTDKKVDGKPKFSDFSTNIQSLLSSKNIVAMTTLTFYKIYLLCQKKSVKPGAIFDLIHRHPGGVFRLEQYMKGSKQAA
jgi:hypothetical protein